MFIIPEQKIIFLSRPMCFTDQIYQVVSDKCNQELSLAGNPQQEFHLAAPLLKVNEWLSAKSATLNNYKLVICGDAPEDILRRYFVEAKPDIYGCAHWEGDYNNSEICDNSVEGCNQWLLNPRIWNHLSQRFDASFEALSLSHYINGWKELGIAEIIVYDSSDTDGIQGFISEFLGSDVRMSKPNNEDIAGLKLKSDIKSIPFLNLISLMDSSVKNFAKTLYNIAEEKVNAFDELYQVDPTICLRENTSLIPFYDYVEKNASEAWHNRRMGQSIDILYPYIESVKSRNGSCKILDIGSSEYVFTKALREVLDCEILFTDGDARISCELNKDKTADIVLAMEVIEHLPDLDTGGYSGQIFHYSGMIGFLENIATYLQDDAVLLLSTPNLSSHEAVLNIALKKSPFHWAPHPRELSESEIRELMERAGLEIVTLVTRNSWGNTGYQSDWIIAVKRLFDELGVSNLLREDNMFVVAKKIT
jgi:hypothetical protein